jgi:GntR family transcriptional regulator / MocR family aminotransferase
VGTFGGHQLALADLLRNGAYDRHLRQMRRRYSARREALTGALREHAPGVELHGLAAGFHAVARLATGTDKEGIVAAARRRSVGLYGMSNYRMTPQPRTTQLVLGFGNLTPDARLERISIIADLLQAAAPPDKRVRYRRIVQ